MTPNILFVNLLTYDKPVRSSQYVSLRRQGVRRPVVSVDSVALSAFDEAGQAVRAISC